MYFIALDLETTGLDIQNDDILELGYAIYHIKNPAPLVMKTALIINQREITKEITEITGIDQEMINQFGQNPVTKYNELLEDIVKYDIKWIVGHNMMEYDLPVLRNNMIRNGLLMYDLQVLDTKTDIKFTVKHKSTSLSYLLADHGVINPFPHRALTDAMSCAVLLYKYDIEKVLEVAKTPMLEIRADVNYDSKDLAKALQYGWDGDRKIWYKKIREFYLEEEKSKAKFPVLVLKRLG